MKPNAVKTLPCPWLDKLNVVTPPFCPVLEFTLKTLKKQSGNVNSSWLKRILTMPSGMVMSWDFWFSIMHKWRNSIQ